MLFDSHAHYDDARFDPDRDALLSSMPQRGVSRILCVAADLDSADKCLALAERYPFVYAAAGVHPHEAKSFAPDQSDRLRAQLAHPKCVALGEIGLDYALDLSPRDLQRAVFSYQLRLAKVLDKPVIIHDREAHADTLALLKDAGCRGVVGGNGARACRHGLLPLLYRGDYLCQCAQEPRGAARRAQGPAHD